LGAISVLALACVLLVHLSGQVGLAMAACFILGLAIGAIFTVSACLTGLLFPAEAFGFVFGALTSAMVFASAIGPILGSLVHDRLKSYDPIYWVGLGVTVISALVLRTLKPAVIPPVPVAVGAA
jgi:MFS family permease